MDSRIKNKGMSEDYMHYKATEIPIYKGKLIIALTNSIAEIKKLIPNYDYDYVYGHAFRAKFRKDGGFYMILNFHYPVAITHGVIAHEAVHLANFIADARGFVADHDNDEPIAYMVEWITNQAYKFINKHNFTVK